MDSIYFLLIFAICILAALGVGLEISKRIDEFVLYVLFWFLYIITIITLINIILVSKYYLSMRNKSGPPGLVGVQGEQGDRGESGKCDTGCRDSICLNALSELLTAEIKKHNNGVNVSLNNIYIKSKIKQICESEEFKQLAPYNGPINLINYLKDVWKIWIKLLYDSGGKLYFETIGAEDQFDWLSKNPFDELKKYDVFYWGMGKQYRPQISERCYNSTDGNKPINDNDESIIQVAKTTFYDKITTSDKSGASNNASFWRAKKFTFKSAVFYPVGDIVIGPYRFGDNTNNIKYIGSFKLKYSLSGPNRESILVSGDVEPPINYELLWTNYGWNTTSSSSSTPNYFWVWRPIAPVNYIALGDVITVDENPPLTGDDAPIRCVPFSITHKLPTNREVLWSSFGSTVDINLLMLGFIPNTTSETSTLQLANEENAYNLFRGIVGTEPSIPDSDVNAQFYYLDKTKYITSYLVNNEDGLPDKDIDANRVGKGYIASKQQDSKYSVSAYLNLKNKPLLTHFKTKTKLEGEIIPNAISNSYTLKYNKQCITYKKVQLKDTISLKKNCDELGEPQYFSIAFTGDKKNECKLKHYTTKKILKFKAGRFTLVESDNNTDIEYTLFIMS